MAGPVKNLLGVVLAGGQSSRMGHDKGLIKINGHTWVERAASLLAEFGDVVISIRPEQYEAYGKLFAPAQLIPDEEIYGGPLRGLMSVHRKFKNHNLFLLAVDLIQVEAAMIKQLIESSQGFDAAAFRDHTFIHSLCAFFKSTLLQHIDAGKISSYARP